MSIFDLLADLETFRSMKTRGCVTATWTSRDRFVCAKANRIAIMTSPDGDVVTVKVHVVAHFISIFYDDYVIYVGAGKDGVYTSADGGVTLSRANLEHLQPFDGWSVGQAVKVRLNTCPSTLFSRCSAICIKSTYVC